MALIVEISFFFTENAKKEIRNDSLRDRTVKNNNNKKNLVLEKNIKFKTREAISILNGMK